jgi:hypothetical protein
MHLHLYWITLATVLSQLSYDVNVSYDQYFLEVKDKFVEVYGKYEQKYGNLPQHQRPPPVPTTGRRIKKVWEKLFVDPPASSSDGSFLCTGELARYINSELVTHSDEEELNILHWWYTKRKTYPVLSILARDVLSVPVSTVSSESAFSMCGRIIDDRRQSLTPDMVKSLMTVKDAQLDKLRAQHSTNNDELIAAFESVSWSEEPED